MGSRESREFRKREALRLEWERARNEARSLTADLTVQGIGLRRFQVAFEPSFEPGLCWEGRVLDTDWRLFRSEVIDRGRDGFPIVVGYEEVEVPCGDLRGWFGRIAALTVPIDLPFVGQAGLDGTRYHLAIYGDYFSEVRLQWWSGLPSCWRPVINLIEETVETFSRLGVRTEKPWSPL